MADTCQPLLGSGKTSLIDLLIPVRFTWGLRQLPRKNESNMPIFIDEQPNMMCMLQSFSRVSASNPMQI